MIKFLKMIFPTKKKKNKLVPLYFSPDAIKNHQYALKKTFSFIAEHGCPAIQEIAGHPLIELENDFWWASFRERRADKE